LPPIQSSRSEEILKIIFKKIPRKFGAEKIIEKGFGLKKWKLIFLC
jgi:hypothetical protein